MIAPERIVAWAWGGRPNSGQWTSIDDIYPSGTEYIRADLFTATQPAPAPQAREITVQEAAEVLLTAFGRAQIDMVIFKLFLNGQPMAALRALADMQKEG